MQMHKAQRHSGSHANLAVNRAHKRLALKRQARVTINDNPNRITRRAPLRAAHAAMLDAKAAEKAALEAMVGHPIVDVAGVTVS